MTLLFWKQLMLLNAPRYLKVLSGKYYQVIKFYIYILNLSMTKPKKIERTRAQESTNAIEKLYISMRHLFSRGFYKPMGMFLEKLLRKSLLL